jgi:NAD(P)-dependent dehydrogenase (short-subunit alcohol dehydrogenase family)
MRENSNILITAAGGKVGRHVVAQLAQMRVSARAGVHSQAKASALRETGVDSAVLDFENSQSIAAAFKGIEALFLVTPGSPDQGRFDENLLAEAERFGVKRGPEIVRKNRRSPRRRLLSMESRSGAEDQRKRYCLLRSRNWPGHHDRRISHQKDRSSRLI